MKTIRTALALTGWCALASFACATPVQFGWNGHWYERVDKPVNWQDAYLEAQSRGGHLATVTSIEENVFLTVDPLLGDTPNYTSVLDPNHAPFADLLQYHWLGGFKLTLTPDQNDGWTWVNGEGPFVYNNWARALVDTDGDGIVPDMIEIAPDVWVPASVQTEPNNLSITTYLYEDRLIYDHQFCPVNGKQWNDLNGATIADGYVIEWDTQLPCVCPDLTPSLLLLGMSATVVASLRRFRVRQN